MNFMQAMAIVDEGWTEWAGKSHNRRWVRKIDGTPIRNDLAVNIAVAMMNAAAAPDAPGQADAKDGT